MYTPTPLRVGVRGLADVPCLTNECVEALLRKQAAVGSGDPNWGKPGHPGYSAPYTQPGGGPYAYVAILPDGQVVTVTDASGTNARQNEFPKSIEDLKAPGITITKTEPGGQVVWSSGAPAMPGSSVPKDVKPPAKIVQDPVTGTTLDVSKTAASASASMFADIPTWAYIAVAGIAALLVLKK